MKDFKKMPRMADGGGVNKNTIEYWANKRSPESKTAAEQRMTEYKEGKAKSSAQFKENMQKTSEAHDAKMKAIFNPPKSGGGGSMGGGDMSGMKGLDKPYKRGGKVTKKKK
jgi:predicted ATP-grasp superfamily ATP-dependent carboligase